MSGVAQMPCVIREILNPVLAIETYKILNTLSPELIEFDAKFCLFLPYFGDFIRQEYIPYMEWSLQRIVSVSETLSLCIFIYFFL